MGAILGLTKVEGNLKRYLKESESKIIDACRITQSMIVNSARQRVRVRFGLLQKSIQEGVIQFKGTEVTALVYALQDYAGYQEYGPRPGSGRRWSFTPYLRPSMQAHKPDFIRLLKKAIT